MLPNARLLSIIALLMALPVPATAPAAIAATEAHTTSQPLLVANAATQAQTQLLQRSLAVASAIEDPRFKAQALGAVAQAYIKVDPARSPVILNDALQVTRRIGIPQQQLGALNQVVWLTDQLEMSQAEPILADALAVARRLNGPRSQFEALMTIATMYSRAGSPEAQDLFDELQAQAEALIEPGAKDTGLENLVRTMMQYQGGPSDALLQTATAIAETIERDYDRSNALISIAVAATEQDNEAAIDAAAAATARIENEATRASTLAAMAAAYSEIDSPQARIILDQALAIVQAMAPSPEQSSALATVLEIAIHIGTEQEALLQQVLAIAMDLEDPTTQVMLLIGVATNPATPEAQAQELLEEILAIADRLESPYSRSSTINQVLWAASRLELPILPGLLNRVLSTTPQIDDPAVRAEVLRTIVSLAAQQQRASEAASAEPIFDKVLDSISTGYSDWFRAQTLLDVAGAYRELGDDRAQPLIEEALAIASRSGDPRLKVDTLTRATGLVSLVEQPPTWGEPILAEALAMAATLGDPTLKANGLRSVALSTTALEVEAAQMLLEQVLQSSQDLEVAWLKANVWSEVAYIYAQRGKAAQTQALLDQTLNAIASANDGHCKCMALGSVVFAIRQLDPELAQPLFEQALAMAEEIDAPQDKFAVLSDIVNAIALLQDVGES